MVNPDGVEQRLELAVNSLLFDAVEIAVFLESQVFFVSSFLNHGRGQANCPLLEIYIEQTLPAEKSTKCQKWLASSQKLTSLVIPNANISSYTRHANLVYWAWRKAMVVVNFDPKAPLTAMVDGGGLCRDDIRNILWTTLRLMLREGVENSHVEERRPSHRQLCPRLLAHQYQ